MSNYLHGEMGIRGLYSFVESYDDFFVDVKLCNERIIIGKFNLADKLLVITS